MTQRSPHNESTLGLHVVSMLRSEKPATKGWEHAKRGHVHAPFCRHAFYIQATQLSALRQQALQRHAL